ncbi:RNA 3'-terminal phosphate cyclase [Desulfurococcus mucosus]|uniref:RNA 3'-terminal phosphate cyclase n=1 Tax=Desulfurococcus mucosus (strain ATCC 35584 / DSM 2162 / JCM 9187 / O7/1) TaxID=765177 RepID=E8R7A2_DESM0|nr:RNA 3'-terminal phosphate cyclase [Desulfurococcus mucosus]ADV65567.1 RNA 3'-phosphate cyclase [Desulfurococcus mucosus DSM 2162]
MSILEIDGSIGEGGGQILRYALALSSLTLRPVRIYNIRAKRDNPGLRPQHLTAVEALRKVTGAEVEKAEVGSTEIVFKPTERRSGAMEIDIGTAGSISLVLQALLPVLVFGERDSRIRLKGGTNVPWSPPIDYISHVFLYNVRHMGVEAKVSVARRGHYPKGGGVVDVEVRHLKEPLKPVMIVKRGRITGFTIHSYCVKLPHHVAVRQLESARSTLARVFGEKIDGSIETYPPDRDPHLGPGSGVLVYAEAEPGVRLGSDSLGEKGKPAEKVGEEAALRLIEELETGMAFDRHMGDMLIPYMFLARGVSRIGVSRITLHLLTAIEVGKLFFPGADPVVDGELGKPGIVTIRGVGFQP